MEKEKIQKLIENTLGSECKVSEFDDIIMFGTKDAILSFIKKKKTFLFNPSLKLYPHESCKIMAELMNMLKNNNFESFMVGSSFVYSKKGDIYFGEEAKKQEEENLSKYIEDEVYKVMEMNNILESDYGFEC